MPLPLFVYGTLMQGQPADGYLANRRIRAATTPGVLYRVPAGYPALVPDPSGAPIHGELILDTEPGLLTVLDLYESTGTGLFLRKPIRVTLLDTASGQRGLFSAGSASLMDAQAYVVTEKQARFRRYHRLKTTDWRNIAPRVRS